MSTYGGANIIKDGLVLALDAGSQRSYPGTGTTWYDLKSSSISSINGPVYDPLSKSFIFNGSTNYIFF